VINEHDIKDMCIPMEQWQRKSSNQKQVGGDHYIKNNPIQPWDFIIANDIGYLDGTAIKYIARWRYKNGIEDLKKAIHFIEKLIESEEQKK
jgi:hypothetical protein